MTDFEDHLWSHLVEHGADRVAARRPPSARPRARPLVLSATGLAAITAGVVLALVLSAAGSSPAFALPRRQLLRHVAGAQRDPGGERETGPDGGARTVRAGACHLYDHRVAARQRAAAVRGGAERQDPGARAPENGLLVIAAWRKQRKVRVASSLSRAAAASVQCPPGGAAGKAVSVSSKHKNSSLDGTARIAASGVTGPCVLAVSRGCFIAAPIATSGAVTGVGDRINTHVPSSRRQPRWPAIGWTPLVLWNTQKRLSGPVHRRRWMPMRSGAAEGVGDAPRPAPAQIDHGGRRGPFPGL